MHHAVYQITYQFPLRRVSGSTDTIFSAPSVTFNSAQQIKRVSATADRSLQDRSF